MKITLDLPDDAGFAILSVIHGNNKVTTLHLNGTQIKYSKTVKIKDDGDTEMLLKDANKRHQRRGVLPEAKDDD